MNKAEFRKEMAARSLSLDDAARNASDEAISRKFEELEEYTGAKRIFAYIGVAPEVMTDAILERMFEDEKEIYVPLCYGKGEMDAVRIQSKADLKPGRYGIPEPAAGNPKILPEELDLIIVPGMAFGEDGSRLGRGAGYYDRFLSRAASAAKIALCREINISETVPTDPHDEYVDIVVSEERVIRTKVR